MTNSPPPTRDPKAPFFPRLRSWDVGHLSQALNAAPSMTDHPVFGRGLRYRLGERGALTVDLYPPTIIGRTGTVQLSTTDLDLLLFTQPVPAIAEDGLHFRTADHVLTVTARGDLQLYRAVAASLVTTDP